MLQDLLPQAERIAAKLKARNETISVAESSTAGLLSAALLAIPGASAYFLGGAVVYTRQSRAELLAVTEQELTGITPSTEPYALLFARKIRGKLATTWSLGETGTAGPTGSRYGHAAGHSCIAVIGPNAERSMTVETGKSDRLDNMRAFSIAALEPPRKSARLSRCGSAGWDGKRGWRLASRHARHLLIYRRVSSGEIVVVFVGRQKARQPSIVDRCHGLDRFIYQSLPKSAGRVIWRQYMECIANELDATFGGRPNPAQS